MADSLCFTLNVHESHAMALRGRSAPPRHAMHLVCHCKGEQSTITDDNPVWLMRPMWQCDNNGTTCCRGSTHRQYIMSFIQNRMINDCGQPQPQQFNATAMSYARRLDKQRGITPPSLFCGFCSVPQWCWMTNANVCGTVNDKWSMCARVFVF